MTKNIKMKSSKILVQDSTKYASYLYLYKVQKLYSICNTLLKLYKYSLFFLEFAKEGILNNPGNK